MARPLGIPSRKVSGPSESIALTVNPRRWGQHSLKRPKAALKAHPKPRGSFWLDAPREGFTDRARKVQEDD